MKKKKGKKGKKQKNPVIEIYVFLIIIATFFIGIGYAKTSEIIFEIDGKVEAEAQEGVFITDVEYVSDLNADIVNSVINLYSGTMLDSKIVLGNDSQSQIVYEVTIQNNSNY